MSDFPEQLPHGDLDEVLPDVFFLRGQITIQRPHGVTRMTRSMTVVRDGDGLHLINTIRMDDAGLAALEALGTVRGVVRIGGNHGRDDAFYSHRYDVPVWASEGVPMSRPVRSRETLIAGDGGPIQDATVLLFETIETPEAVICLNRHGGVVITADSFHNCEAPDEFVDEASAAFLAENGFFRTANIGPFWRKRLNPALSDYERILSLTFRHLLPGHGVPILNDAQEVLANSVRELF